MSYWREQVLTHQNLFLPQVHKQHGCRVIQSLHRMKIQYPNAITDDEFLIHRLDRQRPPPTRKVGIVGGEPIGLQRTWSGAEQDLLVILLVRLMRNDGGALREVCPHAAGVVEMVMCIHEVLDGFVRNELVDFTDHGKGTFFVERRLDDYSKIAEIDREAVMAATAQGPDSIRQLLRLDALPRRRCFLHRIRHRHSGDAGVRLDTIDRDLHRVMRHAEPRVTLVDMQRGGEFHAAEILVIRIAQLIKHVAIDRVGDPGVDEFQHVLVIEGSVDPVLSHCRERDERRLAISCNTTWRCRQHDRDGGRVLRCHRGLQEPVRRQQDVELPVLGDGKPGEILARLRDRILPVHVPGIIPADDEVLLLLALQRGATTTARRIVSLPAGEFFPRVTGIVVDGARVAGYLETRPIVLGTEALTNGSIPAGSGILNSSHIVRTHRFHRGLQYAASVLRAQAVTRDDEREKNTGNTQLSCHRASLYKVEVPGSREYIAPLVGNQTDLASRSAGGGGTARRLQNLGPRIRAAMDMRDALNVELQTLDIFHEVRRVRTWSRQRRNAGTRRKQIGLNDQLLFWHVRHQHSLGVQIPANQVQLEGHIAVGENSLILYRLDHDSARHLCQTIRIQCERVLEDLLFVVALVRFVRDDRNPFGGISANTT